MRSLPTKPIGPLFVALCITTVLAVASPAGPALAADLATRPGPDVPITWASVGDSYSAGEGIREAGLVGGAIEVACARSSQAFGPRAAQLLGDQRGWRIRSTSFAACTGAVTPDLDSPSADHPGVEAQWDEAGSASDRFDVITLSTGGNDIGFADTVMGCVIEFFGGELVRAWDELGGGSRAHGPSACRRSVDQLVAAVASLATRSTVPDGRPRAPLADVYRSIADAHLTDDGVLLVVGYPRLFAPLEEWPEWRGRSCKLVTKESAGVLGDLAEELDRLIRAAVDEADPSGRRIQYVSLLDLYDNDGRSHSLCGAPTTEWLNGPVISGRPEHSFHPNEAGHAATAERVANLLDEILPPRFTTTVPGTTAPPPTEDAGVTEDDAPSQPPITTGDRIDVGDPFRDRCTIAWPTAPTRTTTSILMRTTCQKVTGQFLFVDITYGDPDLAVTPSHSTVDVEGRIADIAESELGFKVLMVLADQVDVVR